MHAPTLIRGCLIAAVVSAGSLSGCGLEQSELSVRVLDKRNGAPIPGAAVEVNGYRRERTNILGVARMMLRPGAYDVAVSAPRFVTVDATVTVFAGMASNATVGLDAAPAPTPGPSPSPGASPSPAPGASTPPSPKPSPSAPAIEQVTLYGKVVDPTGARVKGATVYVESDWGVLFGQPATTNTVGEYRLQAKVTKGTSLRVAGMADGYETQVRRVAARGEWRLDFAGGFALKPIVSNPELPTQVRVVGRLEDTQGRALKWAVVRAEAEGTRYAFKTGTVGFDGQFELTVPTNLPLRFTASAPNHRTVTFVETVKSASPQFDFTGYRALEPKVIKDLEAE